MLLSPYVLVYYVMIDRFFLDNLGLHWHSRRESQIRGLSTLSELLVALSKWRNGSLLWGNPRIWGGYRYKPSIMKLGRRLESNWSCVLRFSLYLRRSQSPPGDIISNSDPPCC
jgi:hypothetical protein